MNAEGIICIIERGKADAVTKAAVKAGAGGATVFFGRGAGAATFSFFHSLNIDSAKEIITIVVTAEARAAVVNAISKAAQLDEPGKGILFTFPITEVRGIKGSFADNK
jgi:Nitrogen regulatory protein PII